MYIGEGGVGDEELETSEHGVSAFVTCRQDARESRLATPRSVDVLIRRLIHERAQTSGRTQIPNAGLLHVPPRASRSSTAGDP
jgi:hypothetical protein